MVLPEAGIVTRGVWMHCSDLERYLEACLDGRLGRGRTAILRRHLAACRTCRARVDALKSFEEELHRRFRCMDQAQSLWAPIELDLVGSGHPGGAPEEPATPRLLPPPKVEAAAAAASAAPSDHRAPVRQVRQQRQGVRGGRLLGLILVIAACGTVLRLGHDLVEPAAPPPTERYQAFLAGERGLELRTADAESLRQWFADRLDRSFPMPPRPEAFELIGGRVDESVAGTPMAVIAYRNAEGVPTLVYARPQLGDAKMAMLRSLQEEEGVSRYSWENDGYSYAVVGPLPADKLSLFAR